MATTPAKDVSSPGRRPTKKNQKATIVIITHKTTEINVNRCLSVFKKSKNILKFPMLIRLYN